MGVKQAYSRANNIKNIRKCCLPDFPIVFHLCCMSGHKTNVSLLVSFVKTIFHLLALISLLAAWILRPSARGYFSHKRLATINLIICFASRPLHTDSLQERSTLICFVFVFAPNRYGTKQIDDRNYIFSKISHLKIPSFWYMEIASTNKALFVVPERKFSRENGISWKVDQNSQTEFPNGKWTFLSLVFHSSRRFA